VGIDNQVALGTNGQSLNDAPPECRSAADAIWQVKYPATLNHDVGILQQLLPVKTSEVPRAAPEHHRYDVHRDLVDEPECQRLPADIAGCDGNVAVDGEFLGDVDRAAYVVDELAGRLGMPPSGRGLCVTTTMCSPAGK
jgi:hypothetical protein